MYFPEGLENTPFKDVQMISKHFFDISTGFRYKKIGKEFSVHL